MAVFFLNGLLIQTPKSITTYHSLTINIQTLFKYKNTHGHTDAPLQDLKDQFRDRLLWRKSIWPLGVYTDLMEHNEYMYITKDHDSNST